jgi:hypothetical protein
MNGKGKIGTVTYVPPLTSGSTPWHSATIMKCNWQCIWGYEEAQHMVTHITNITWTFVSFWEPLAGFAHEGAKHIVLVLLVKHFERCERGTKTRLFFFYYC